MYLTLEVVSPQAASLGADRRRTVGPAGLTIGRMPGNDWVIPDDYISKHHARITFTDGTFLVEGLGRNPLAIGSPDNIIPNHQPRALRGGDRLFIDQYEVRVAVVQGELPGAAAGPVPYDPFGIVDASPLGAPSGSTPPAIPRGSPAALVPEPWDSGSSAGIADTAELDPLNALGGAAARADEPSQVDWQGASPLADHFEPPAPGPAAPVIDPNWRDHSVMASARPQSPQPAPPRHQAPPRPAAPVIDPNWQDHLVAAGAQPASARAPLSPRQPGPTPGQPPRPRIPPRERPAPGMVSPAGPVGPERQAVAAPARQPATAAAAPSGVVTKATALPPDLVELFRAAGLSERDVSPQMLQDLGQVLRIVVQGVMEALRARDEIKTQFRLPLTRVQAEENNPLKRCPNVQGALHTLLVERNPGYLATVPAFEDAFASIRSHQMAMLEGLRVAFESMLKSFDPKELSEEFEKSAGRGGLLGLGSKAKYWDLYVERFSRLGSDADDVFRRLFGDVFAEAYERQLERLKSLGS